jgi:acylglycerol lipase
VGLAVAVIGAERVDAAMALPEIPETEAGGERAALVRFANEYRDAHPLKQRLVGAAAYVPLVGAALSDLMSGEHQYVPGPNGASAPKDRSSARRSTSCTNWHESQFFLNKDGLAIFWRHWPASVGEGAVARGVVVVSHGLAEHCGRYDGVARKLAAGGFEVYALDHQGHGQSEGARAHVMHFSDFVSDVHELTRLAAARHTAGLKVFLIGHSMGALIAVHSVHCAPGLYDGVVLCSPPLRVEKPPGADLVVPNLASLMPKLRVVPLEIATLCRDDSVCDRYMNDPLVFHGNATLRLINELASHVDVAQDLARTFATPYLLVHGTADKICLFDGSESFHSKTPAQDKTFVPFEGHFHELLNEGALSEQAGVQRADDRVVSWLLERA